MAIPTIFGALLILFGMAFGSVVLIRGTNHFSNPSRIVGLAILAGVALLFSNRITELTIPDIGTIKAATQQATTDAATITALKKRVEDQSATVDLVAAQAVAAQKLSQGAEAQTKRAEEQLAALKKVMADATATLSKLKAEQHIVQLIVAAQNDDRHAYDELLKIGEEKGNAFATLAGNAWLTIYNAHSASMYESPAPIQWRTGVDPAKLSFNDLKRIYSAVPVSVKPALLEYIWQRKDISKVEKMEFFLQVMKNDPSLTAAEYAGRYFEQEAGLNNIKAMALPYFINWWAHHRKELLSKQEGGRAKGGGATIAPARPTAKPSP